MLKATREQLYQGINVKKEDDYYSNYNLAKELLYWKKNFKARFLTHKLSNFAHSQCVRCKNFWIEFAKFSLFYFFIFYFIGQRD